MAGVLESWAEPAILDALEGERRPSTQQVSHLAMDHAIALSKQRAAVPDNLEDPGAEGARQVRASGRNSMI